MNPFLFIQQATVDGRFYPGAVELCPYLRIDRNFTSQLDENPFLFIPPATVDGYLDAGSIAPKKPSDACVPVDWDSRKSPACKRMTAMSVLL